MDGVLAASDLELKLSAEVNNAAPHTVTHEGVQLPSRGMAHPTNS